MVQTAQDNPIKVWKKSIAPFMYPIFLFILLMLHFISGGSAQSAFFLLSLTVIFSIGAYFLYDNEYLAIYEDKLEYKYGIWNPEPVVLKFGEKPFSIILPERKHLLQRVFKYNNLLIQDKHGRAVMVLRGIRNAPEFYRAFSDTVNNYLKSVNPEYEVIPEVNTAKEEGFFERKANNLTGQ